MFEKLPDRERIVQYLTMYDIKQSKKKYYNKNALSIYFGALEIFDDVLRREKNLRKAILSAYCGQLADFLLKQFGMEKMTEQERRG